MDENKTVLRRKNMTEQDLKVFKEHALSVESVVNRSIDEDTDYMKVLQIFIKQQKLIADEETRVFNEKMQEERFQLEKDRIYSDQQLGINKLAEEKRMHDAELTFKEKIESTKLEIEKMRLELERESSRATLENAQSERKFRYVSLAVTTIVGLASVIVPLVVYRKLAYANLKLIYKDEGRPTQDFKDAVRCIKNLTK